MPAEKISAYKTVLADGAIVELVVWRVPQPVPGSTHSFKYRAAYVVGGVRVIGFDNERGKGDHCHIDGHERPYSFITVERLVLDFAKAIDDIRSKL